MKEQTKGKEASGPVGPTASTVCRNCGWEVARFYCPNCGQHVMNHNAGLWQFIQEFLEEFVRFDSKLVRTLVPLIAKPGFLTKEWAAGKRMRYISPLKLYITISAVSFIAVSMTTDAAANHLNAHPVQHGVGKSPQGSLDRLINRLLPGLPEVDPAMFRTHFFSHLPTASLILIPITGLVFAALYYRQKRFYVEHLVFTLHYNSFCFLTFGVVTLFRSIIATDAIFLWSLGYLLVALKENYGQGWGKSFVKFILLSGTYSVLLLLAILGTVEVSAYMTSISSSHSVSSNSSRGGHEMPHVVH